MKTIHTITIFCCLFFYETELSSQVELQVPYHAQNTLVWCWAASLAMVLDYEFGQYNEDCVIVSDYLERYNLYINCCNRPDLCTRGAWPFEIFEYLNRYTNNSYNQLNRELDFDEIKSQIDNKHPILICYSTYNNFGWLISGHAVVIVGYNNSNNNVRIFDPFNGRSWKRYSEALKLGNSTWDISFIR